MNESPAEMLRRRWLAAAVVVCGVLSNLASSVEELGGDAPEQGADTVAQVVQVPLTPEVVVPMLLMGTYAPYETAGYAVTSLNTTTGAFRDLAEKTCAGGVAYAQNKKTGLALFACQTGATYSLNSGTLELRLVVKIPTGAIYLPTLACTDDGTCFIGRGNYSRPGQPSTAALVVLSGNGSVLETMALPDRGENRVPLKMRVIRNDSGKEKLVVVTQGYSHDDIGVHTLDVETRKWQSLCSIKAEQVSVGIGKDVVLTLRRGLSADEPDALVVDASTCAIKGSPRIPIDEMGIPIARFAVQTDEAIYLGGGSERTQDVGPFGVWKFDATTYQNTGHLQTPDYVFAGTYAKSTGKLWVATRGSLIFEIDTNTMTKVREFSKPLFGGDMFYVE